MKNPKVLTFEVEGRGSFPLDMLRYDACYPSSEQNSHLIEYNPWADDLKSSKRTVRLMHRVLKDEYLGNYPTKGRWESFGWKVVDGSVKKVV